MNSPAKFGANRTYRFQVIQLLAKLMFSSAAILDFKNDIIILSIGLSGLDPEIDRVAEIDRSASNIGQLDRSTRL